MADSVTTWIVFFNVCLIPFIYRVSSGYQREGAQSAGVNRQIGPAAGFPLHVHLLPRPTQLSFPACWR